MASLPCERSEQEIGMILRIAAVQAATGLPRSTIYRYIKKGLFPRPIKLGPRTVGWFASAIAAWAEGRRRASGIPECDTPNVGGEL